MKGPAARTALALLLPLLAACSSTSPSEGASAASSPTTPTTSAPTSATPVGPPEVVGTVATGLSVPWGLAFLPDGTALVSERTTKRVLRVTASGQITAVGTVDIAQPSGEGGLLGLAVSPTYTRDHLVYAYVTTADDNRVVRFTLDGDRMGTPEPRLTGIPKAGNHNGGRLLFAPNSDLLVSTGDAGTRPNAQSDSSLGGKIVALHPDGSHDIVSKGHRNVQGMAYDAQGRLWASEFGQDTWDELNLIRAGGNYGWPTVEGASDDPRFVSPLATWRTSDASPSGLAYAGGSLWMAGLRGERLWRIPVNADGSIGTPVASFESTYGRLRTVVVAPDGNLWVTTSNRDGRGSPTAQDDRILVVRP